VSGARSDEGAAAVGGARDAHVAGEDLFVTVKAVEYHLANSYRKLGVNGRSELAPLLHDF
jgi:DNA-binding NarL/FixJ family response regulator